MLSETSAVTFFGSLNFFFLLFFLDGNGVDMAHFGHVDGSIFGGDVANNNRLNSPFVMPGKPAWLRINFRMLIFLNFLETKV